MNAPFTPQELLTNIKARLPEMEALLARVSDHWGYEDPVYRFYHGSFKVYSLQETTREIVDVLEHLAPEGTPLCPAFVEIVEAGASGKRWEPAHNQDWTTHTRPIVEAFLHARYFLEMAVRYGNELHAPPMPLPSGWAALLVLYGLR